MKRYNFFLEMTEKNDIAPPFIRLNIKTNHTIYIYMYRVPDECHKVCDYLGSVTGMDKLVKRKIPFCGRITKHSPTTYLQYVLNFS